MTLTLRSSDPGVSAKSPRATNERNDMYEVSDLQAVEPDQLSEVDGISWTITEEADSMGFPRVTITGPTREAVIQYARDNWGDMDDPEWFKEWVIDRVEEVYGDAEMTVLSDVDDAWYAETKGDLALDPGDGGLDFDRPLAENVLAMHRLAHDYITTCGAMQNAVNDRERDEITEEEAVAEIPQRIARALAILMYGA